MGLDDFIEDDVQTTTSTDERDVSLASSKSTTASTPSKRWLGKLDYSKPYVVVAEDDRGDIYTHKGSSVALKDADDWRRLGENPYKDIRILAQWSSQTHWLKFCSLAAEQYDEDPNDLFENDIERLIELQEKVYWTPGSKPDKERTCHVCGDPSLMTDSGIVEIDLHKSRRVPVCSSHTVKELAENGLLD